MGYDLSTCSTILAMRSAVDSCVDTADIALRSLNLLSNFRSRSRVSLSPFSETVPSMPNLSATWMRRVLLGASVMARTDRDEAKPASTRSEREEKTRRAVIL
jgi:hypothetical protein